MVFVYTLKCKRVKSPLDKSYFDLLNRGLFAFDRVKHAIVKHRLLFKNLQVTTDTVLHAKLNCKRCLPKLERTDFCLFINLSRISQAYRSQNFTVVPNYLHKLSNIVE